MIVTDRKYRSDYIVVYLRWNIELVVVVEQRYRN
jgi:hypothetical protein